MKWSNVRLILQAIDVMRDKARKVTGPWGTCSKMLANDV